MYNFVLQIITILSLSAIVFLVTRALPRIAENENTEPKSKNFWSRNITDKIPLDKLDYHTHSFLEKFLRKLKVLVMKSDNFVDTRINRLKKTKNGNGRRDDIKEHVELILEDKNESTEIAETSFQDEEKQL